MAAAEAYRFEPAGHLPVASDHPQLKFAKDGSACPRQAILSHPDLPPCAGCGRCCHLVVELRAGDQVPDHLVVERDHSRFLDQHGDGACVALDPVTLLCTIYAGRPQTCRDFDRGGSLCRQMFAR